jgi:hypothetical protein
MSIKDFKKGIEAGAKPFEDKFKQHAEAITRVSDKLEAGMDKVTGVVEAVIDDMSVIEKKRLYDLNTQYDLQSLEDYEKELLVAGLFTLAKGTANENQQSYVRSVTKYLGIKNPQTEVDLSGIENIESLGSQKAMFQTFAEFIFLEKEDVAVLTEYEDLFDLFSVKKKDCLAIFDNILKLYKVVGAKGLSEKFGFTVNAKGIKAPVVVDILNVMLIDKPLDIAAGEEKVFTAQKIRLIAPIICNGKLTLQSCVIVYNSASIGDGFVGGGEGSVITLSNCTVIDQNDDQWDKDEAAEAAPFLNFDNAETTLPDPFF